MAGAMFDRALFRARVKNWPSKASVVVPFAGFHLTWQGAYGFTTAFAGSVLVTTGGADDAMAYAALAQLVRALDCGSRGPRFEPGRWYQNPQ